MQKTVTFVTTTRKALLSVAKTNGRLTRHKLYTGNIDYHFLNSLAHISPYPHIKKVRNRSYAPKTANSDCCYTN